MNIWSTARNTLARWLAVREIWVGLGCCLLVIGSSIPWLCSWEYMGGFPRGCHSGMSLNGFTNLETVIILSFLVFASILAIDHSRSPINYIVWLCLLIVIGRIILSNFDWRATYRGTFPILYIGSLYYESIIIVSLCFVCVWFVIRPINISFYFRYFSIAAIAFSFVAIIIISGSLIYWTIQPAVEGGPKYLGLGLFVISLGIFFLLWREIKELRETRQFRRASITHQTRSSTSRS
jgi:hypothetical protein